MPREFFPFVEEEQQSQGDTLTSEHDPEVKYPARIAVYDDPAVTPRVVVIEPMDVRDYLAEITKAVTNLAKEQGGTIPFTIIREIVENFIHAYFIEPTITILDGGNTIRFCDQGPGIKEKEKALQFGTTSATDPMKHYIRGVGSGLPIAQQYMLDKGGSLTIQDNISSGTIVTISTRPQKSAEIPLTPHENSQVTQVGAATEMVGYQNNHMNPYESQLNPLSQNGQPLNSGQMVGYPSGVPAQTNGFSQALQAQSWPNQQQGQYGQTMTPLMQQQLNQSMEQALNQLNQLSQSGGQQGYQSAPGASVNMSSIQPQVQMPMTAQQNMVTGGEYASNPASGQENNILQSLMTLQLSERQKLALGILSQVGSIGGKQLAEQFGGSAPTWSRELSGLDSLGITIKDGQKRKLTEIGKAYVRVLNNMR